METNETLVDLFDYRVSNCTKGSFKKKEHIKINPIVIIKYKYYFLLYKWKQ